MLIQSILAPIPQKRFHNVTRDICDPLETKHVVVVVVVVVVLDMDVGGREGARLTRLVVNGMERAHAPTLISEAQNSLSIVRTTFVPQVVVVLQYD
jgi:hypothetical protein